MRFSALSLAPHHVLASLVKGEVLSPEIIRATTGGIVTPPTFFKTALSLAPHHVLASLVKGEVLSPEKIRATTGGIVTPPTFFKTALSLAQHHVLASPRKRGGGTAVEVFRLAVQYSDSPAFTILKLFRAVTVGIAPHPHYQ